MPLFAIAALSIREAASRRLALVVAILSVLAVAAATWLLGGLVAGVHPREAVPAAEAAFTIFFAFVFSAGLAIAAAFIASPAVASDLDSGIALAILPRPLSRAEYVLGKWLGLTVLVTAYTFAVGGLACAGIGLVTGVGPPHPFLALAYLAASADVVLTIALCLGTRLPAVGSGILAVALFGVAWVDGFAVSLGQAFQNSAMLGIAHAIALALPSDVLWRGTVFELQPDALLGGSGGTNPFLVPAPPELAFLAWTIVWFAAVLGVTIWRFDRRDV
jgi:ABC-type transport system involved in multi-copper enzyme maturation permease subunit